jgi:hypothetical protein
MPYKDPIKRREKEHEYQRAFDARAKEKKTDAVCSVPHCSNLRDDPRFKKCSACRSYMRVYKAVYRNQPRPKGRSFGPGIAEDSTEHARYPT